MLFRIVHGYIVFITQVHLALAQNCPNSKDGIIEEIDICRQQNHHNRFSTAYLYFHTDGLDPRFSLCVCQVTSDSDAMKFDVLRHFTLQRNPTFDFYLFAGNESRVINSAIDYYRGPINPDVPWTFLIKRRHLTRDITLEDQKKYCIYLQVIDRANLSLQCETYPSGNDEQETTVTIPILVSCLMSAAVVFLTCGVGIGFCFTSKSNLRELKEETPIRDYNDSGIASDGQFGGHEVDTGSEYATIDSTNLKPFHINKDGTKIAETSLNRNSVIMIENDLYA